MWIWISGWKTNDKNADVALGIAQDLSDAVAKYVAKYSSLPPTFNPSLSFFSCPTSEAIPWWKMPLFLSVGHRQSWVLLYYNDRESCFQLAYKPLTQELAVTTRCTHTWLLKQRIRDVNDVSGDDAACNKKQRKDNNGRCTYYDHQAPTTAAAMWFNSKSWPWLETVLADYCLDQFWVWIWASLLVSMLVLQPFGWLNSCPILAKINLRYFFVLGTKHWYIALTRFLHWLFISNVKMWAKENKLSRTATY